MKPQRNAAQLRDLVQARLEHQIECDRLSAPTVGLPHAHPADALGRNWDIAEVRGLRRVGPLRVVIDSFREAYDLA